MISGVDEYLQTGVMTASPHRLHMFVIDTALRHARMALEALDSGDFPRSHDETSAARKCVSEVLAGMRADVAPDLIRMLRDYFLHVQKCLHFADLLQDRQAAEKAINLLQSYRETWAELRSRMAD
jgi:flagellar protein FliS